MFLDNKHSKQQLTHRIARKRYENENDSEDHDDEDNNHHHEEPNDPYRFNWNIHPAIPYEEQLRNSPVLANAITNTMNNIVNKQLPQQHTPGKSMRQIPNNNINKQQAQLQKRGISNAMQRNGNSNKQGGQMQTSAVASAQKQAHKFLKLQTQSEVQNKRSNRNNGEHKWLERKG